MLPLTPDDLAAPAAFAADREDLFDAHARYVDRYRRVRVGPAITFVFENRRTLRFRVQDVLRVAGLTDPRRVRAELAWYNRLLPRRNQLQAAAWVAGPDRRAADVLTAGRVWLRSNHGDEVPAARLTDRVGDRVPGAAHWFEFHFLPADREAFADPSRRWWLRVAGPDYGHDGIPLDPDVHESLRADLGASDAD